MRILAIEPYYDGSHRAFLDGWREHSRHAWTILDLPGFKWKWRMRHASLTIASRIDRLVGEGFEWDLVFCTDMLNLPEMMGLTSGACSSLPTVAYFHENQLTYPSRQPRDYQYAYSNFLTAVRADRVWFNSEFHRNDFLGALKEFLRRMPDYRHVEQVEGIRQKSAVQMPGIAIHSSPARRSDHPLRLLWCARWEHDKNPEEFFSAIRLLKLAGHRFRLGVIGPSFRDEPEVFAAAKKEFSAEIEHWGYQKSGGEYRDVLSWADVVVSTADHEFFGLSVVEAMSAGAFPVLPNRLAYPEVLGADNHLVEREHLYSGRASDLADHLSLLIGRHENGQLWAETRGVLQARASEFQWDKRSAGMDDALDDLRSEWLAASGSF